ncbi:unnamed protein product [Larinioides sclopetarius]
MWQRICN